MHTRRLIVERLEPRTLLSAGPVVGTAAGDSYEPLPASELNAGLSTTVLPLATGEILTLGISPDELVGVVELGGLTFGLDPNPNDGDPLIAGIVANGIYNDGLIDLFGPGSLESPFHRADDPYSAVLKSGGELNVQIGESRFEGAGLVEVEASVDVQIDDGALKLAGTLTGGKLDEQWALDLQGVLTLREDFLFTTGAMSATLKAGGEVTADFQSGELVEIALDGVGVDVDIDVAPALETLKLNGSVQGKYHGGKIDLDGSLSLVEPFTYKRGKVTATLKPGGSVGLKVEQSQFKSAELTGIEVEADIDIDGQPLSLEGAVSGKVHEDYTVDLVGSISVEEDFTKQFGDSVTATLKQGGSVDLNVERSEFQWAELKGLTIEVTVDVDGQDLSLEGSVGGKVHNDYKIDLDGSLSLVEPFTYKRGKVTATLKPGGSVGLKVEQSQFKSAELKGVEAEADIDIDGSVLELEGAVSGKVHEDYTVDLVGSLSVREDFTKRFGDSVTATLMEGGKVDLNIERSEFQWAELMGMTVEVTIDIGHKELSLEGSVGGKVHQDYKIDLDGSLSLVEPFTYERGEVTATLKAGGALDFKVERSEFKSAELSDVDVLADVAVGQSVLKLAGSLDGKINEDIRVDFTGGLTVTDDFEYRRGDLTLRIGEGEDVSLATRADGLLEVGLDGVALEADVTLHARKTLELAGIVTDGSIVDGLLDLDAEMDLRSPLVLRSGPARVAIVSADVGLSVDDGEIDRLQLRRPVVEVVPPGRPRRDDKSRFEDSFSDDDWNDPTAAVP